MTSLKPDVMAGDSLEIKASDAADTVKEEHDEDMTETNPWAVESLDDFLHYCCPECDVKSQYREFFVSHALLNHPQVSVKLI